jgi:hypothetical protein
MTDPIDELLSEGPQSAAKSRSKAAQADAAQAGATAEDATAAPEHVGYDDRGHDGDGDHDGDGGYDGYDGRHGNGDGDDRRPVDWEAEARLENLDDALHGPPAERGASLLFWDGTTDQDRVAYDSIEFELAEPPDRPKSDRPGWYPDRSKAGS